MGEIAVTIAKWALKTTFFLAVTLAIIVIVGIITSYMIIGFNTSVLADIFALIQLWLPFNINILLLWLTVAGTAYIAYRLAMMSYSLVNSFLGKN